MLLVISCQLSVISCQLSILSCQFSVLSFLDALALLDYLEMLEGLEGLEARGFSVDIENDVDEGRHIAHIHLAVTVHIGS